MENIENILKENLRSNVHIDKRFSEELGAKLKLEALNKFIVHSEMNESSNNLVKAKPIFLKPWFMLSVAALVLIAVTTTVLVTSGFNPFKISDPVIVKNDVSEIRFAKLYVNSGNVNITRNGTTTSYGSDVELEAGDIITTSDNTIADVLTKYGRFAVDNNSQIIVNEIEGQLVPEVKAGNVFISLNTDNDKTVRIVTSNAEVTMDKGAALITQNSELTAYYMNFADQLFAQLVKVANAVEVKDGSTKVLCLSGDVKVKSKSGEVTLEKGKEVVVKQDVVGEVKIVEKDELKDSTLVKKVITDSKDKGIDTGVLGDMVAPEVTIIAPVDGVTVETNTIEIKFKSNEDGWYIYKGNWIEITANQEVVFTAELNGGANKVEFYVKDKAYNKTFKSINVNYNSPVSVSWSADPVGQADGVKLAWGAYGTKPGAQIFKVIRNDAIYQSFSVREDTANGANWVDGATVKGTTYSYAIAIYENGVEVARTQNKSVVAQTEAQSGGGSGSCNVNLYLIAYQGNMIKDEPKLFSFANLVSPAHAVVATNNYKFGWTVSEACTNYNGYKLVWNQSGNPVYPGDTYSYVSNKSQKYTVAGLSSSGNSYVRVGLYNGGPAHSYSNQLTCGGGTCW